MRKVQRLLLIHWYGYNREIIEFGDISFLTGKTASGKSTIIDALQLLLLGDSSGSFFNKAANTKSVRTLKGYLFGETGDDGDTGFQYLRKGPFTSYIALEFLDTDRNEQFVTGFTADCYSDQTFKSRWFILRKSGLPENLFIDPGTKVPYSMSQDLRPFLNRTIGKKRYEFYDTNRAFQNALLGIYGQVRRKYLLLLRKAVPFTPITDIEQFITESICDVRNRVNVGEMQSEIRQYKHLEEDAGRIRDRIERLEKIHDISERYEQQRDTLRQQEYIVDRAEQAEILSQKESLEAKWELLQSEIAENQAKAEELREECAALDRETEELRHEYFTSDLHKRQSELQAKIREFEDRLNELSLRRDTAMEQIRACGERWNTVAEALQRLQAEEMQKVPAGSGRAAVVPSVTAEETAMISGLMSVNAGVLSSIPIRDNMKTLAELQGRIEDAAADLRNVVSELKENISVLSGRSEQLQKGIKPYPNSIVTLKALLERELAEKTGKAVPVHILADLLEIRDFSWQNAIEGYLDRQKFYLLVPERYYQDALRIYHNAKRELNIYDAGLVDIGSLRRDYGGQSRQKTGSLSEEIETQDPDARLFADYLLGNVMKCDDVSELNRHRTAITRSCMLYKGYVARRINPKRYANPFIGRESVKRQLQQVLAELEKDRNFCQLQDRLYQRMKELSHTEIIQSYELTEHEQSIRGSSRIPALEKERDQVRAEYNSLDFTWLEKLEQQIDHRKMLSSQKSDERQELLIRNGRLEEKCSQIHEVQLPAVRQSLEGVTGKINTDYPHEWVEISGEPRFRKELEKDQKGRRGTLTLRESFRRAAAATQTTIDHLGRSRSDLRADYNAAFRMPYDIHLESNREYDQELEKLSENELPAYVDKIRDSREKAYNQFRDDFIAKLKSNIEDVRKQVDELNASLRDTRFGTDRYRFTVRAREEYKNYYDMIMDPLLMDTGGWNVASESFNKKYQKEIDELFRILILSEENASEARRQEYERNVEKFTDYRSYLVFDLIVSNEEGEEQRLSKMLNKKSGGETQVPFYIALLASFSQVLRIRSKQNNTIRMIILDEAFSKLDGERIQQCIPLLRQFGLQAVFSAPPEKIPDIAPLAGRNIAVYKDGHHSFTRHFDPREIEDESTFS